MPDANPRYEKIPRPESIEAFRTYVSGHSKVSEVQQLETVVFRVQKAYLTNIGVVLTNIYTVSQADVLEILSGSYGITVNAIVTMSAWNGYTDEAKDYAESQNVGLFTFKEFMGALNFDGHRFTTYRPKKD